MNSGFIIDFHVSTDIDDSDREIDPQIVHSKNLKYLYSGQ